VILCARDCAGTDEERGITKWRETIHDEYRQRQQQTEDEQEKEEDEDEVSRDDASDKQQSRSSDCYDPPCGMPLIRRWTLFKFLPFCPTFLTDVKRDHTASVDDVEANDDGSEIAKDADESPPFAVESFGESYV